MTTMFDEGVKRLSGQEQEPMIRVVVDGRFVKGWPHETTDVQGIMSASQVEDLMELLGNEIQVPDDDSDD